MLAAGSYFSLIENGEIEALRDSVECVRRYRSQLSAVANQPPRTEVREDRKGRYRLLTRLYAHQAAGEVDVSNLRCRLDGEDSAAREYGIPRPGRPDDDGLSAWILAQHYLELGNPEPSEEATIIGRRLAGGEQMVTCSFPLEGGPKDLTTPERGWLGEVALVAKMVSEKYHWAEHKTVRWLLCEGEAPPIVRCLITTTLPVDGVSDTRVRITLEVDPMMTPGELKSIYSSIRSQLLPVDRARHLSPKKLALVSFIMDQPEEWNGFQRPPWQTWLQRWNEGPAAEYGTYDKDSKGRWTFERDATDATRRLQFVGWEINGEPLAPTWLTVGLSTRQPKRPKR
ncbi:MAG: hypothetical protein ACR2MN_06080 [Acidimicrobiales bacterium]